MNGIVEELIDGLSHCDQFMLANACLTFEAWKRIEAAVCKALKRKARGTIIIGLDLYQTEPEAMKRLLGLADRFSSLRCHVFQKSAEGGIFHPKVALFMSKGKGRAVIGSSNLSEAAMSERNIEADCPVTNPRIIERLRASFNEWLASNCCHLLTRDLLPKIVEQYKRGRARERQHTVPRHVLISPRQDLEQCANLLVDIGQLEESISHVLQLPDPGLYAAFLALKPGNVCRLLCLGRYKGSKDLVVRLHPADTLSQSKALYARVDIQRLLRLPHWNAVPNFHLIRIGNHTRFPNDKESHPNVKWVGGTRKFMELFQSGLIPLGPLERSYRTGFDKALRPYYEHRILSRHKHSEAIHQKYVLSGDGKRHGYSYIYPCPGLTVERVWDRQTIGQLQRNGRLAHELLESIDKVFGTWGQKVRLAGE